MRQAVKRTKRRKPPSGGVATVYRIPLTLRSFEALMTMDEKLVGTADYMGIAYWWGQRCKQMLREATPTERKATHDAIIRAGLPLDSDCDEVAEIVTMRCSKARRLKKWLESRSSQTGAAT